VRGGFFFYFEELFNLSPVGSFIGSAYQASPAGPDWWFHSPVRFDADLSVGRPSVGRDSDVDDDDDAILSASTRLNDVCQTRIGEMQKLVPARRRP